MSSIVTAQPGAKIMRVFYSAVLILFAFVTVGIGHTPATGNAFAAEQGPSPSATTACIQPDTEQFLEASRASIGFTGSYFPNTSALFFPAQQESQWMGASWEGPAGGVLFLIDCIGKELAHINLGAVEELKAGPVIPAGQTAEVLFNSVWGTGVLGSDVAFALVQDASIKIVWRHKAKERVVQPKEEYEETYRWKVSPDGKRITVMGSRKVSAFKDPDHGWAPGTTHVLPKEQYCWNAVQVKFLTCQ